jgi:hypothetical protein
MQLQKVLNNVFVQLAGTVGQLSDAEFTQPCSNLVNNTIGQHVRHIIELFQCLQNGYNAGSVNYEDRKRDVNIETNRHLALELLQEIYKNIARPDKELVLTASYSDEDQEPVCICTNYYREIAYNIEHTIHHMALIRVGIREAASIALPEDFGVASSTIKHRKQCAQ